MSRKNLCEIVFILDRSGSMRIVKSDAIGGFNQFIEDQKKVPGDAQITLIQFDNEYETVFESKDIQEVSKLDDKTYTPRGTTALIDAIGKTIDDLGNRLSNIPEENRPEKVIIGILTDGHENSSVKYKNEDVKNKIKHQQEVYGWQFMFIAAGADQWDQAQSWGLDKSQYINVAHNAQGTKCAFASYGSRVAAFRTGK